MVHFWPNTLFFSKIQKHHFTRIISGYLDAKSEKKLMAGNMRTCVPDRQTERLTEPDYYGLERVLTKQKQWYIQRRRLILCKMKHNPNPEWFKFKVATLNENGLFYTLNEIALRVILDRSSN